MFTKNWYKLHGIGWFGYKARLRKVDGSYANSYYTGFGNIYSALELFKSTPSVQSNKNSAGIVFGSGVTPPTANDYCLENMITTISGSGSRVFSDNDDSVTVTYTYTLSNTGSSDVTISEVGIQISVTNTGYVLVKRTLLDSPITILAGGVGQVTYTISMNYPTA